MRSVITEMFALGLLVLEISVASYGQVSITEFVGDFSNMTVGRGTKGLAPTGL